MRTALDAPLASLDEHEQRFVEAIREHGFFSTSVFEDDEGPGFSYTTGFWITLAQPELIMFGLPNQTAHDVFWDCYRDIKAGRSLPTGARVGEIFAGLDGWLRPVVREHYADHLGWSRWFYGDDDFPCLQLVWPDAENRFPWETDVEPGVRTAQPDLSLV